MGNIFNSIIKILIFGRGESSNSSTFMCDICLDHKPFMTSFALTDCTHFYCSDCVCKYVTSKIQDKIVEISCPVSGCNGRLDPEHCRSILKPQVSDKRGDALCEGMIPAPEIFCCPFKDCSALFIKGPDFQDNQQSECPICHKLFSTKCMVPWHSGIKSRKFHKLRKDEFAESSNSSTFMCEICLDHKAFKTSFAIKGCTHSYCCDCVCEYVTTKIQDKIVRISCPVSGCNGMLDREHCRSILKPHVFDKWGDALCEALIPAPDKFYCPFKDCSALLIKGPDFIDIVESECPICHKLFCAKCMVPWHSGIKCSEFQKLHKDEREQDDILLKQLAKEKKWTRCSKCKFYVERTEGCLFMRCRCGYTFCYHCGSQLKGHYCKKCKR